jgi:D-glycero-alpha-D-manno-heptose 1-phosphate guanylyltransferase
MALVNNLPFLHYQLLYLKHFGFENIIFSTGYLHHKIEEFFGDNYLGLSIIYAIEKEPMGTGGGIRMAIELSNDDEVLVLNGDSFFDCDLNKFYQLHQMLQSQCSLALRKTTNASRFGTIQINSQHQIVSFKEKTNLEQPGIINAGVYILNQPVFLTNTPPQMAFSIEKDFFEKKLNELKVTGFEFEGYFIDIGIPNEYKQAQHDFERFKY